MTTSADRMVDYCRSIANEFQSRMNRLQLFVSHNLSSGTANESLLREFLLNHAAAKYDIGQGFIYDERDGKASRQCDVLIYNRNDFSLVYSDGPIKVVWRKSAKMTIEVKTNFGKKDIETAIENIRTVKDISHSITGMIFAFTSSRLTNVTKHIKTAVDNIPLVFLPEAILLLDKDVVIHRWKRSVSRWSEPADSLPIYEVIRGKNGDASLAVTFLLLHMMEILGSPTGIAEPVNILLDTFDNYTEKVEEIRLTSN